MSSVAASLPRRANRRAPPAAKKSSAPPPEKCADSNGNGTATKPSSSNNNNQSFGERTVKKLRLSNTLTIPEGTTVYEACQRMAAMKVDAVLLSDPSGLLSGIVTSKDISIRVVAELLRPEQTIISKVMTRNPVFVMSDTLAIEALQKMVQGKFRHLPVVENDEVIAMLDITKCLYDAISRMEKAAEQGSAIAAAVEGVERQWGSSFSASYAFIETLRERMFKPSLSTIITENKRVAVVSPSDPVHVATKKMREHRANSVVIMTGNKLQGILTSKDVLMRVVAQNLSPELTLVEKVMTPNPECLTLDKTILDALNIMHDGNFLHLPVLDSDGRVAACLDVLQITHAVISMVEGGAGAVKDVANTMMQKFWDSALSLDPTDDECDTHSDLTALLTSEHGDSGKSMYPPLLGNSFSFKFEDSRRRVHRFNSCTQSLEELVSAVIQRLGLEGDRDQIHLLYEDDEGDKVLLVTDNDLIGAVERAKLAGWKVLRLHLDSIDNEKETTRSTSGLALVQRSGWSYLTTEVIAGAVAVAGIGIMVCLSKAKV